MYCTICTHSKQIEIVEDYIYSGSLRRTSRRYDVGYRSLHRHIDLCLASIYSEAAEREYQEELKFWEQQLRWQFGYKPKKKRPKSIITKPVEFTWSRRSWKKKK